MELTPELALNAILVVLATSVFLMFVEGVLVRMGKRGVWDEKRLSDVEDKL